MSRIRTLGVAALALALALMVTTTQAAEKGKKKGHAAFAAFRHERRHCQEYVHNHHNKKGGDEETKVIHG